MPPTRTRPKTPQSPDRRLIAAVSPPLIGSRLSYLRRPGRGIALLSRQFGWTLPSKTQLAGLGYRRARSPVASQCCSGCRWTVVRQSWTVATNWMICALILQAQTHPAGQRATVRSTTASRWFPPGRRSSSMSARCGPAPRSSSATSTRKRRAVTWWHSDRGPVTFWPSQSSSSARRWKRRSSSASSWPRQPALRTDIVGSARASPAELWARD